jgi:hypothetical protein
MIRVQLVGTQRSGSNMLRLMLGQLDDVFAPPSAHELRDFQPLIHKYFPLNEHANLQRLADDLGRLIDLNALAWPCIPNRTKRMIDAFSGSTLADAIIALYDAHARFFSASCWVSKCLENVYYVDQLLAANTSILYVHLIRDPRDVAASFIAAPIGPKDPGAIALRWREDQLAAEQARVLVGNRRWIVLRYEDLVKEPRTILGEFCRFAKIEWSEVALDFHLSKSAATAAEISVLWKNLNRPIDSRRIGTYRTELGKETVEIIEGITGDVMQQFRYTPETDGPTVIPNDTERRRILAVDAELRTRASVTRDPEAEQLHLRREYFLDTLRD